MRIPTLIFSGCVFAVSAFLAVLALGLPGSDEVSTFIGPRLWPLTVLVITMLLSILLGLRTLAAGRNAGETAGEAEERAAAPKDDTGADEAESPARSRSRHWLLLALVIAWTVAMEFVGFATATVLFAAVATWLLGNRNVLSIVVTTVVSLVLVSVVFNELLNIPLP
ncbi:tripartite tricarboxylate transporter TctB family protein [Kushneria sinocarnis]|uniref:Tripartite tricarboxylate transporter TctB family protein n=1 Tax=Kushneria sinocarnis TaxID=595502 RepID=A0A420X1E6_9GAMM|nr:tripartite tricarboxylate transporter TctB family protein [Kushneria sinocarnis]RKR07632.1 tripartite tricarboxylate transporter TctB family protein [Kushneria sinocarnis]